MYVVISNESSLKNHQTAYLLIVILQALRNFLMLQQMKTLQRVKK